VFLAKLSEIDITDFEVLDGMARNALMIEHSSGWCGTV